VLGSSVRPGVRNVWDLLAMGGYGAYVWAAYGFTILVLGGLLWQSRRAARKRTAQLADLRKNIARADERRPRPLVARRLTPAGGAATGDPENSTSGTTSR
jgi:heme exporter protein CcmD